MSMPNIPSIQTPPGNPEFVNLDSRYKCIVCHNVLRDAMQTTCGHRLCEECLPTLFDNKEEPVDCPANEDDCQAQAKSNITIDPGCRREVSRLKVKCTFRNAGCDKQMLWKDLEAHELDCACRQVACPNKGQGCAQMIPLANVEKHVNTECTFRLDTCKYCQQRVPLATLEHHVNDVCPSIQLPFPFSCGQPVMSRDELNQHKAVCTYKPVECTYKSVGCTFMGTEEQVASHLLNDVNSHLDKGIIYAANLKIIKEIQESERDKLQRQIQEQKAQIEKMQADIDKIKMVSLTEKHIQTERKVASVPKKEAVDKHEKDIKTLQTTMTQVRAQMSQIESGGGRGTSDEETKRRLNLHDDQFANLDRQMAELDLRFQILETANFDGILLLKLRDYTRRKREAIQGRTLSLYSQPFYTHRFGYKMCARVYLNGGGMGKGTHLSLFFVIMRGEFDNLLTWPFKQKVTMILMDQENGQTPLSDTFIPDTTSSSFKQPSSDMNIASGCPLFVSHTILESPKYLRDDTIFIKVIVDLHNLSPP